MAGHDIQRVGYILFHQNTTSTKKENKYNKKLPAFSIIFVSLPSQVAMETFLYTSDN